MLLHRVHLPLVRVSARSRSITRPSAALQPRCRPAASAESRSGATQTGAHLASLAPIAGLLSAAAAHAEDATPEAVAAEAQASASGFGPGEIVFLAAPLVLYGIFNVWRDRVNPKATFLDFFYLLAFAAIIGNIVSILVFKTRFF